MPPAVAEHLKSCTRCRAYVTTWNAVELRFRSLKDEWPTPAEVRRALGAGHERETVRARTPGLRRRLWVRPVRALSVAAAVVVILGIVLYATAIVRSNANLARNGSQGTPLGVEALDALRREAPVAATH
jgi:anti-sigma factor RsiW